MSSPKILTLDNKKARIKQGVEYAYLERDSSGGSSVALAGAAGTKGTNDVAVAEKLIAKIDEIAEIFWATKK